MNNRIIRDVTGSVGLAMIFAAIFLYEETTSFPGVAALLPTVGSAFVIWARDGIANRLLSLWPFVAIGLISYALYLWHWPIFVFIDTYYIEPTAMQLWVELPLPFPLPVGVIFLDRGAG